MGEGIRIRNRGLSQEGLKLIACLTMLVDHVGELLIPVVWLRLVGRLAFPIYCFLLAEGMHYTKAPRKYALRLFIGVLLAELPFDYALFGGIYPQYQSVMLTLFLGCLMIMSMKQVKNPVLQLLLILPFALGAEWLCTDYGGLGVLLIALFVLTREMPHKIWIQMLGMAAICYLLNSPDVAMGFIRIPMQMFALLSLIPIGLYSGRKVTSSRVVQWAFYLFYPVHLIVLYLITAF